MKQVYRGGFVKPKWALGLCVLGVLAAVAVLLATPPISQNSAYKTASAKHRPLSLAGASRLAFNNLAGQSANQAQGGNGAVLGATTTISSSVTNVSQNSMSYNTPAPSYSSPVSTPPSSAASTLVPAEPDYFYPIDPPPCKFQTNGSYTGGCSYCADYFRYPCGCGYRGADIACIAPE